MNVGKMIFITDTKKMISRTMTGCAVVTCLLSVAGCAGDVTASSHDFVVAEKDWSIPVHVGGGEAGISTAALDNLIKDGVACGLRHAPPSEIAALGQRNLRLVWSVIGEMRPEFSSVSLHAMADGLPAQTAMERINLQQSPRPMFVQAVCSLTNDSLAALSPGTSARTASGSAHPLTPTGRTIR